MDATATQVQYKNTATALQYDAVIAQRAMAGVAMDLVERETSLQQLHDELRVANARGGRLALLGGEAGAGKTSLLRAFAAQRGATALWWGGCDALQTPHPLAPLHDIARSADTGFGAQLQSAQARASLFEAVLSDLVRQPTLVVIEDAHWADAATLDLLKFLGRRIDQTRCLLIVSFRDDEVDAAHPLRRLMGELPSDRLAHLDVPRLSPAAVAVLAQRALRPAAGVFTTTQGNAFFVSELLRHGASGVPRGVQDLVLARFAKLSAAAQDIVRATSVVPTRIERALLEHLVTVDAAALDECLTCGLLLLQGDCLQFRHELARAAVELNLPLARAQALHARTRQYLEQANTHIAPARLAHHATRSRDSDAVLRLAPRAADEASRRGAHKEAAVHLRDALAYADRVADAERAQLLDRLAYECYLTECIEEAIETCTSAWSLWHRCGNRLRAGDALRRLSRFSWYHGQGADATRYADAAIVELQTLPPSHELAMAYSNRAQLHMLAGETAAACEWGGKALTLARQRGDIETEIHALNNMGAAQFFTGDGAGLAQLQRSLELALLHGYEEHAARAYTNLGFDTGANGDYAQAEQWLERGIAYCEAHDLDAWLGYMRAYRSEVALWRGNWPRARELAEHVLRHSRAPVIRIVALTVLGRVRARRGEPDAQQALDDALHLALPTAEFQRIGPVAAARAEASWLRGDTPAIAAELDTAWRVYRGTAFLPYVIGELAWWQQRIDARSSHSEDVLQHCPPPYRRMIEGDWRAAASDWMTRGCVHESARALACGDGPARVQALTAFEQLGAKPDADIVRRALRSDGVRGVPRGRRRATRLHPQQLTPREAEILHLLCRGLRNAEIAQHLHRSVRTVDHHLASIFAKLGVATRAEAISTALLREK